MSQRPPGDGRDSDDELARIAAELNRELRRLRSELEREGRRDPPTGPLGLPRPPSPGELLEFADEVAIPALIAILEANIKLLEGLQAVLRLADGERELRERGRETGRSVGRRATEAGDFALESLTDALYDLQRAIENDALPEETEGGDVLDDIRDLRTEIDDRIRDAGRPYDTSRDRPDPTRRREDRPRRGRDGGDGHGDRNGTIPVRDRRNGDGRPDEETGPADDSGSSPDTDAEGDRPDDEVGVDVEAELDSLRERYRGEEDGDGREGDDAEA
jgi:hypothetical protein